MFIPLHDANRLRHIKRQYVTLGLIAANALVFVVAAIGGAGFVRAAAFGLGFIPSISYDLAVLPPELAIVPAPLTYVTYTFVHGDIWHLAGNMLFLWVFGDNIEDAMGHARFLFFYVVCGALGAMVHGFVVPQSGAPLIGASGAIAGIVAAYLMLHPKVKIWVLAFARIPLRIPAFAVLGLWIIVQFSMLLTDKGETVSWAAHVGGILAGAILLPFLKRGEVPLFDRRIVPPRAVELEGPSPSGASAAPAARGRGLR